jgi:hypothetical protein
VGVDELLISAECLVPKLHLIEMIDYEKGNLWPIDTYECESSYYGSV